MITLKSSRNYIVVTNKKELELAKQCDICGFIIWEQSNVIYLWTRAFGKWVKEKYVVFGQSKDRDEKTTGLEAYQSFYKHCGKTEIQRMKSILSPIPIWESSEGMHYCNIDYIGTKLKQPIFEFDANSAYTYGVTKLPNGFELLKDYMLDLFDKKKRSANKLERSKYKNMQNYLIGFFARVKEFVAVRSNIIAESNKNIQTKMVHIVKNKGTVFLSNTDSIVTDEVGASAMARYVGDNVGEFKINTFAQSLYYNSPNCYQLDKKVVHGGVKYFARKHTDFINDKIAKQSGELVDSFDFELNLEDDSYSRLCRVRFGTITVTVSNLLGEEVDKYYYKVGE